MVKTFNQRGVTSLAEYAMTFFLVILTIVGITTYLQRSFQARLRDARAYVAQTASTQCDNNCMNATGLPGNTILGSQYEPYYTQVNSDGTSDVLKNKRLLATPWVHTTGIYIGQVDSQNVGGSNSTQQPPIAALVNSFVLGNK